MPNVSTLFSGIADVISAAAPAVPGIVQAFRPQPAPYMPGATLPGGAPAPGMQAGMFGGFDLPMVDIVGQGSTCITPRASGMMRLPSRVDVPKVDASGNTSFVTFKNMGRPVLWSGDLAATKRTRKVAARARRARGGR